MQNLGAELKTKREKNQISLTQVHADTRMSIKQLENIESGDLKALGNYGYAKINVISYARYLGMNEKSMLIKFKQACPPPTQDIAYTIQADNHERSFLLPASSIWISLLVIMVVILSLVASHYHKKGMLSYPFKSLSSKQRTDKVAISTKVKNPQVKITTAAVTVPKLRTNSKEDSLAAVIMADSTDYVHDLLFEKSASPLNYQGSR